MHKKGGLFCKMLLNETVSTEQGRKRLGSLDNGKLVISGNEAPGRGRVWHTVLLHVGPGFQEGIP